MVGITRSEFLILRDICLNGPSTAYDISKKRNVVSDKTAYTLLPRLRKNGFVSVSITGKTHSGLTKKTYSLTLVGASQLLVNKDRPRFLLSLIRNWVAVLPHVLGVWDLLRTTIKEDTLQNAIERAASEVSIFRRMPNQGFSLVPEPYSENDEEAFMYLFYWTLLYECKDLSQLLGAIQHERLRAFLQSVIEYHLDLYKTQSGKFDSYLRALESVHRAPD